jgi:hypothetical protein
MPDGTLMFGGYWQAATTDVIVGRLTPAGVLDTTFNGTGTEVIPVGAGTDKAYGIALQTDGKIVLVGEGSAANQDFSLVRLDALAIDDYSVGTADWSTGNAFGACLQTVAGGAAGGGLNGWTVAGAGNCTTALTANWQPIAANTSLSGAKVAAVAGAGTTTAQVTLRFGMRAGSSQSPGSYMAPVVLEVIAPNA